MNIHEKEENFEQDLLGIDPDQVDKQIENLKRAKVSRDNDKVQDSLSSLQKTAKGKENVMPLIIDCVKIKCTLGEISDVLRLVFGEY